MALNRSRDIFFSGLLALFLVMGLSFANAAPAAAKKESPVMGTKVSAKNNPNHLPEALFPLWNSMTLEEKLAQMIMVYMTNSDMIAENNFGGILVMGTHLTNLNAYKQNLNKISSRIKVPLLVSIDQEGGGVNRARLLDSKWSKTPSAREMSKMGPSKIMSSAEGVGKTLRENGFNLNLAPAVDPAFDSKGHETLMKRLNRTWGDSIDVLKVRAFVQGMQKSGIASALKHFPGYDSERNSDTEAAASYSSYEDILKNTRVFKALVPDAPVIMMSSVHYLSISKSPAVFEKSIVDIAHEFNDDVVVMTDNLWATTLRSWISKREIEEKAPYPDSDFAKVISAAVDAGNDILLMTYSSKAPDMKRHLLEMALQDEKNLERMEKSVARILKLKYRMGLLGVKP